jgi:hypothetical protein
MLKPLAVAALVISVLFATGAARSLDGPALIRVTATTVLDSDDGITATQGAWITDKHGKRIGWAIVVCDDLGTGGPLGSGTAYCDATYLFPKGRIQAQSTRKNRSSYVLAIIGGTGLYSNVGGTLLVETISEHPRVERLLFSLEP